MKSLARISLIAIAAALVLACGASAPRPTGPGPEYEDPPVLGTTSPDAGIVDAANR